MTRGFVTIATGDTRYYKMAQTLLRSYRQNCDKPMPFAIISDRHNRYTLEFNDVVILPNANRNWMDKLALLTISPYDETIFIDADCLVYRNINFLWDVFADAADFSCFGKALPMDSTDGWFTNQAAKIFPIQFITHLHGILYFIRKGDTIDRMNHLCETILSRYNEVTYKGFNDRLADEPVFALAMAILGLKPVARQSDYYCFVPFATQFSSDYTTRTVTFCNPIDGAVDTCRIVHWGNQNTLTEPYRTDAFVVNWEQQHPDTAPRFLSLRKRWYRVCNVVRTRKNTAVFLWKRAWSKITGT